MSFNWTRVVSYVRARIVRRFVVLSALFLAVLISATNVYAAAMPTAKIWRLLDYVAVDYAGAVQNGRIVSDAEYAEMVEFASTARMGLADLPAHDKKPPLSQQAQHLEKAIEDKADPEVVARIARTFAADLLAAYPVELAPAHAPDVGRGAVLYTQQCASCHGAGGDGKGSAARNMDPPPIAFTDENRARQRSVFALHQVIEQGLDGTAMPSFAQLPPDDRWALAFYVGSLAYPEKAAVNGERLWREHASLQAQIPGPEALARMTPAELAERVGEPTARDLMAYLRRAPEAAMPSKSKLLDLARTQLSAAVKAYEMGDRRTATDLALSAYLDGIEPLEPALAARDRALLANIETAMGQLRASMGRQAKANQIRQQATLIEALFTKAEAELAKERDDSASAFVGALTILLREGLEALLIVIAMVAFLKKAERRDMLVYVHAGWLSALAAGVFTWAIATYLIRISGASRELTEGFGALFAAAVLISVGIWMHGKSHAEVWQRYIQEKLTLALSRRSALFLTALAFVVVYREVFETILFFAALWNERTASAVIAGAATAVLALGAISWAMLGYSQKLPIGSFFALNTWLISALSFVITGKGVAALQEAGAIPTHTVAGLPQIDVLGIYPNWQTIAAQFLVMAILVSGFLYNRRLVVAQNTASKDRTAG